MSQLFKRNYNKGNILIKNTSVIVQAYKYLIDVLSRAVKRYNATHINHLKLTEDGKIIELRTPLRTKSNYEEKRPEKIFVARSLEDKEVEVTSTESILEIIWKRNGKIIVPKFPSDKIIEIKEYLESLRTLPLTIELKTQVADFLAPYLQFLE